MIPSTPATVCDFHGDGPPLSPVDYADLLLALAKQSPAIRDGYLIGGAVEALERRFAEELGKERALFLPTGTLANHLAVRHLARQGGRVLVQAESHLYRDSVDCAQRLSGLNLVPLGPAGGHFSLEEVEWALQQAAAGPYPVPVGAISIESPVRRLQGQRFGFREMERISALARSRGIGLHLDGARLPLESVYTGTPLPAYAGLFDTVYISLYKCFGAPAGAVLAGPGPLLAEIAAARKSYGADLNQGWNQAAVALHFLEGFPARYREVMDASEALLARLEQHPRLRVERIPNGTNVCRLIAAGVGPREYQEALARAGVTVRLQYGGRAGPGVWLAFNESIRGRSISDLANLFFAALP